MSAIAIVKASKSVPEDFFIGNSSDAIIKAALRDNKPFQLWPDQVMSFNKGESFGVNVASVAQHIEADILEAACSPEMKKLSRGRIDVFDFTDHLQHAGYLGVGGKSEIPDETYLMFVAQKIDAFVFSELAAIANAERQDSGFSVTRWGSDEGDWD